MKWPFTRNAGPITKMVESSEAEKAAVFTNSSLFLTGQDVLHGQSGIEGAYSSSWIAYSCIRRIAQDAAGVPLLFLSDPNDLESHVPATHPTRRLFERPNPQTSTNEFMQWIFTRLNQRGEYFILFDDPMRPTEMMPHTDALNWKEIADGMDLEGWRYQSGGITLLRLPTEIIHHGFVDPSRPFRGQAPLDAAAVAYGIETGTDGLTLDIVKRGGEKSAIYEADPDMTPQQREQAIAALRSRRSGIATVARDIVLPNGVKPLDPKFIEDDTMILEAGKLQPDKIASVYGVPKSMIGLGTEETYLNAQVKKRTYFEDTLVPMAKGVTDSFDRYFVETLTSQYQCYVRFDWASVAAMQANMSERIEIAGKMKIAGVPWAVINDHLSLGLDVSRIPGADTVLVPATLAPADKLISEWDTPSTPSSADGAESGKILEGDQVKPGLTNKIIRKRARDTRSTIQRGIRMRKDERAFAKEWKALLQKRLAKSLKAAPRIETADDVDKVLSPIFEGLGEKMGDTANPHHTRSALEGERSIVELVEGKMADMEFDVWRKAHAFSPGVKSFLKERENFVVGMEDPLFDDIREATIKVVTDGGEVHDIQKIINERFHSAAGGINRANIIARTEIGTAFNTARFDEMKNQDFEKHEWLTAAHDDVTRESHIAAEGEGPIKVGDNFQSVGMPYPQYSGGAPEEVINCRCQTIPVLKGS